LTALFVVRRVGDTLVPIMDGLRVVTRAVRR
jgi:hypothetical protein